MKTAVETDLVGKGFSTIAASCRCATHYCRIRVPALHVGPGRRARSINQVGLSGALLHVRRGWRFTTSTSLTRGCWTRCNRLRQSATGSQNWPPDGLGGVLSRSAEARSLLPAGSTDSTRCRHRSASTTCLVRFDNNTTRSRPSAVGRPVEVHGFVRADVIVIRHTDASLPSCRRSAAARTYDPCITTCRYWLATRCLAQRRLLQFKDWVLFRLRSNVWLRKLTSADEGQRQNVDILNAVLTTLAGLLKQPAPRRSLTAFIIRADVVPQLLARQRDPAPQPPFSPPAALHFAPRPDRRLCPLRRQTSGEPSDGTSSPLRPHGRSSNSNGMKAAFDESCDTAVKTPSRNAHPTIVGASQRRDQREAGPPRSSTISQSPSSSWPRISRTSRSKSHPIPRLGHDLAGGVFIAQKVTPWLIGGQPSPGKTLWAIAIAISCIRSGARGRFYQRGRPRQPP